MKVSFIIPTFNCVAFLPHAVKSCQDQSIKDIEIIIIDDCSTDTTSQYIDWLLKQGDSRIVYRRNEKNMGRSYCRNLGNKIATGGIICVNDADDISEKMRAEWTIRKMKKCQVCYGSAIFIDAVGNQLKQVDAKPIDKESLLKPYNLKAVYEAIDKYETPDLREIGIVHSSMAYTFDIAHKYAYSDGLISDMGLDDWEMQVRMLRDNVKFEFIPDVLCAYRVIGSGISNTRNPKDVLRLKSEILEGVCAK